ncbi:MAG: hypothetical protein Q8J62_09655, partial [Candidatus Cloacimonadaceae bacterium]|nr:hypothetical protein [Candidatus Cloacimonadaceae bacterium]
QMYFEKYLSTDVRILEKLIDDKPQNNWISLVKHIVDHDNYEYRGKVKDLILATKNNKGKKIADISKAMINDYYGIK